MSKLFSGQPISQLFSQLQSQATREINSLGQDYIASNSDDVIIEHFLEKCTVGIPTLKEDNRYQDEPREGQHQGSLSYKVHIPFSGEGKIFSFLPSSCQTIHSSPSVEVQNNEIIISFSASLDRPNAVEEIYSQEMSSIRHNIKTSQHDINIHLQNIKPHLARTIAQRRAILNEQNKVIGSLTIPIKRTSDQPATFHVPEIKRIPKVELKKVSPTLSKPEPTLSEVEYEHILKVIHDMSLVIERSPKAFAKMEEMTIRDILLVQLNGHYQGMATGETFNGEGKTDILIRYENTNLFIAECKFWTGKEGLLETFDQLLGYVTWRDTKTAIILFNKGKNLSKILDQLETIAKSHKKYKSSFKLIDSALKVETAFGYKFEHPSDSDKEIFLSLLVFQVNVK